MAGKSEKGFLDGVREDRYVLIVAVAILIFIASSSIALISESPAEVIAPVPAVFAIVDGNAVSLAWNASESGEVNGYDVYRSTEAGALGTKLNAEVINALWYRDSVHPGTYYYTIRAVANTSDDGNTKQLEVMVARLIPSGLSIAINEGGKYALNDKIILRLSAKDAKECRYKNDEDLEWGAWEAYKTEKMWTLSAGGDGERLVAYQCRNAGESDIALASTVLDRSAPIITYVLTPLTGAVQVNIVVRDAVSPSAECEISQDGTVQKTTIQLSSGIGSYVYNAQVSAGVHSFSVKCTDEAGNAKETPVQNVTVK